MTTRPTYQVAVDWDGDGDFDAPGEDITTRTLDRGTPLTAQYGRDEGRAFAPLSGGRAGFEVDNRSGDYSPENTASPLAGNLQPGRQVQVRATYEGLTYGLMRGYTDDYKVQPGIDQRSVNLTVVDGLARLRRTRVSTPLHHSVRTGQAIGLLLDAAGWPANLRDLDVGATTIPWWWAEGDAFAALQEILDAEGPGTLAAVDIDGRLVFRDRHHRILRSASTTVQATWRSGGVEPAYSAATYEPGWTDVANSVEFDIPLRAPAGQLETVWTMSGQRAIADGETVEFAATASDPFFGAVTPQAGVDYTMLSGVVTVSLSRTSGASTTVRARAVGGPAVVDGMAVRAHPIITQATVRVRAEDSTSITESGRLSWPSDRQPALASLPDAAAIADIILANRARRQPTITVTFRGCLPERLRQQLGRDLSDRVHIIDADTGLDADCTVERIEHTISDYDHVTTFAAEKIASQPAGVLVLDDASLGKLGTGTLGVAGLTNPATMFVLDDAALGKLGTGILAY